MNRKIRTAIAVIAGLAVLSSIAVTSVASAARPITDTVSVAPVGGVAEMVNDGGYWKSVEGWALKGGKAADQACQQSADLIYDLDGLRLVADLGGDKKKAAELAEMMDAAEDDALSAGCVILYT